MKTLSSIRTVKKALALLRGKKRIGFVPTMGAFHEGHLSLMRAAKRECDVVVVSLFVNPLQFGPSEDLSRYPRDLARDKKMAESAGVDWLWTPQVHELVPSHLATFVSVEQLSSRWEGASRPGHFRGVATIVTKLFHVVQPDCAYFGQKDYQQETIIKQLVRDLHFDLRLRVLPTVRESDGLAKSSRNVYLPPEDRQAAAVIYRALCEAKAAVKQGERDCRILRNRVESALQEEPRLKVDYIALCHPETLEPVDYVEGTAVLLIAAWVGPVRLIDNLVLKVS